MSWYITHYAKCNDTWQDPVLVACHYRRMFKKFLNEYVLKKRNVVVNDWSYVMEAQGKVFTLTVGQFNWQNSMHLDRDSPHMHMVLWTERDAESLLEDESIVCARLPPTDHHLYTLVTKYQRYQCNDRYRKKGDPLANCRFHFPKPIVQEPHFESNHAQYCRGPTDVFVNQYNNTYLLSLFQCSSIKIQVSRGLMHSITFLNTLQSIIWMWMSSLWETIKPPPKIIFNQDW